MVIAVGLSSYNLALFHLVNHAFYKALLFLGAGAVIHAVADNQDFRRYGGLRPFLPLTYSVMLIASLSLVAFPFMTGFYSKDLILESAYGQFHFSSTVVYVIATIGAMFTTLYSVKVLYLTFLTNPNGPLTNYKNAHEGDIFMSLPLMILAVFSIFFGFITKDMFIGLGSGFFSDNALFIHPSHEIMLDTEFGVPTLFKLLPLIFTILLSVISIVLSEYLSGILISFKLSRTGYNIFSFFNQRFLIELFYNRFITGLVLKLGGQTTKVLDKGSVEYLGPYGLEKLLLNISGNLAKLNTGVITSYALYILVGLIFYILFSSYFDNFVIILALLISLSLVSRNSYSKELLSMDTTISSVNNSLESRVGLFTTISLVTSLFIYYLCILKDKCDPWLEWALHNPPKPHAFISLPLQSSDPLSSGDDDDSSEGSSDDSNEGSSDDQPDSEADNTNDHPNSPNSGDSSDSPNEDNLDRMYLHEHQLDKYEGIREIAEKADRNERLTTPEKEAWAGADQDLDGNDGHLGAPSVINLDNAIAFSKSIVNNDGDCSESSDMLLLIITGTSFLELPVLRWFFLFFSCISNPCFRIYLKALYLQYFKK